MNTIEILFSPVSPDQRDLLIALLDQLPIQGFWEVEQTLKAYFNEGDISPDAIKGLITDPAIGFEWKVMEERNWNKEWEEHLEPIFVDDFCGIRAKFLPPLDGVKYEIIITPKMSFGTGYHATTRLMIKLMKGLNFEGKRVLDFGCGTGVLAILAKKMGAGFTLGLDNDAWAVQNAIENCKQNDCAEILVKNDKIEDLDYRFDCIFANITRNTLLKYMEVFFKLLNPGGFLLLSGFLGQKDAAVIQSVAKTSGFNFLEDHQIEKWTAALFQK